MAERVFITDVAPRDGLQNEPGVIPTEAKIELIHRLASARLDMIEATSFVSPRWIPQLGDAGEVMSALRDETDLPPLCVLVPNARGFERAAKFHSTDRALTIAVFTAASETFSERNTNASIGETIERFAAFLPGAFERGMRVRLYISCAIACPFEGPIAPAAVRRVADQLLGVCPAGALEADQVELDLGDTIGAAKPEDIEALLDVFPEPKIRARLVLHLHDTFGRAGACVRQGLDLGVRRFDGSVAGLGGCPYAGTKEKPAPGNISTELLVDVVEDAGFETGVDRDALQQAAAFARRIVAEAHTESAS